MHVLKHVERARGKDWVGVLECANQKRGGAGCHIRVTTSHSSPQNVLSADDSNRFVRSCSLICGSVSECRVLFVAWV